MNIGFLGGRFDPVHFGHLGAAHDACLHHRLDRVVFVPTAQVAHQSQHTCAAAVERVGMLRLAIAADPRFEICEFELGRMGASYTLDSVRHFRGLHPSDRLFWIIGSDQLTRLHEWKGIGELIRLIEFIVLLRPGHPGRTAVEIPGLRLHGCAGRPNAASSTELRNRVKRGQPLTGLVPATVAGFIAGRELYRQVTPAGFSANRALPEPTE